MRNKLVESLNRIFEQENCPMSADSVGRIADQLIAEGFGLIPDREMVGTTGPVKLGDTVFVPYLDDVGGVVYLDELPVTEISSKRLWVGGDDGFDFGLDEIGERVFLSLDSGMAHFREQGMDVRAGERIEPDHVSRKFCGKADVPCEVGDVVFVPYFNEDTGVTEIDELKVTEVSQKRIWVCGDEGYDYSADDFGKTVFLSRKDAEDFIQSPEYLAERVNWVLLLNVSDNAKREMLVKAFGVGQEYFEPETERYMKLTAKGPFDVWKFEVFDSQHEFMYGETAFGVRLANDVLGGELVPAYLQEQVKVKEQGIVANIISGAKDRVGEESKVERERFKQEREMDMV